MTEKIAQEALQAVLSEVDLLLDEVTISDWSPLDGQIGNAVAIISRSGAASVNNQPMGNVYALRRVRVSLYVPFMDWPETQPRLRDLCDAVELKLTQEMVLKVTPAANCILTVQGLEFLEEEYVYNHYIPPESLSEALPDFLGQTLDVVIEEEGPVQ